MGGCCIGNCCIGNCGFCCIIDFSCSDGGGGGGCCVGYTSTYNDGSVDHSKKINEELNTLKDTYEARAAAQEQTIIMQINESMDDFIKELEKQNNTKYGGRTLNINISAIRQKREDLSKDVVGFIGTALHDRIVNTDPELAPILKERDDTKRNANIKKFCDKVLQEAKEDLKKQVKKTIAAQQDIVKDELKNRLAEIDKSLKESTVAYDELLAAAGKDEREQERLKLQYMYEYGIYSVLSEKMGIFDDIKIEVPNDKNPIKVKKQSE